MMQGWAGLKLSGTCTISVAFAPTTAGLASATLGIAHNAAGSPATVTLGGTGVLPGPLAGVTPASLAFGSATTGTTTASQDVTISNSGVSDLVVAGATEIYRVGGAQAVAALAYGT